MLTGNKGEWSEIYVFLKLLADGRLNAADANLNAIPNVYYPIIKILRQEATAKREFSINGSIKIIDGNLNKLILTIPIADFVQKSQQLFNSLKAAKGRSFSFPAIETFLNSIDVKNLAALKTDKADIRVVVHDLNTGLKPTLGFSIKSMLGGDSTLFNPAAGTNFIFKITKPTGQNFNIKKFNSDTLAKSKQTKNSKYKTVKTKITELLTEINLQNPIGFDVSKGHPFYEYKIKNFLTENALGMTPETVWTGKYDATGGIIIVKENGDLVCYHIYNKNEFQDYLINNTKFEQASTSEDDNNPGFAKTLKPKPYKFGWVYDDNGDLFIKLNLQIRFT